MLGSDEDQAVYIRLRADGGVTNGRRARSSSTTISEGDHHHHNHPPRSSICVEWPSPLNALIRSVCYMNDLGGTIWVLSTDLLAASHVDTMWLHRFSILLIAAEYLRQELQQYLQDTVFPGSFPADGSESPTLEIEVVWLIPIITAIASFSFFLSLMVQLAPGSSDTNSQALVLVGLIALAVVECLVPIALTGCTALFWFDVFSAETALLLLFVVWVAAAVSSRCIRCVLYPNLGHG
mmetsp:Transcript_12362/g.16205  ORF Transcript_12362/g.16205 Transcript_12362/m.16205 type:complete len:237 (-) Transcript_12362:473-1183(-)|eukprot:CAMPEP_0198155586 /NCGR_PEP_ID=MMETSP1443-20131203/69212_1 /TAXON_ID=186043 /ORGANISM="Entomoneis sp., Strain CCMP2396" /LENGTH=236 /DNA_ID=CAMNT_0043822341 /DNA_START=190 /DNA_END=900 /DNA_ORIENTATION=-